MVIRRAAIVTGLFIGLSFSSSGWSSDTSANQSLSPMTGVTRSQSGAWYGAGDSLPTSPQGTPSEREMAIVRWVATTVASMSLEEKIGQLIMMALPCNPHDELSKEQRKKFSFPATEDIFTYAQRMIKDYHVGGILWVCQGKVVQQVEATNELQALSKIPLLIAQDFEPGLVRLPELIQLPWALTIGACSNTDVAFFVGQELARRAKRLGVHLILAPVADVYSNPNNPVIHYRSFGQNPGAVTQRALKLARGIQEGGLLACGKHFPGHGDTHVDSHVGLPVVDRKKSEWLGSSKLTLDNTELPPFKALIKADIAAIMTGHIEMTQLNSADERGLPASLSRSVINILVRDFEFGGLIITDALNMGGIASTRLDALAKKYGKSKAEIIDGSLAAVLALQAGNDIVLYPADVERTIEAIKQAIDNGCLREKNLDAKVSKVLFAKACLGLHRSNAPVSTEHILDDLNTKEVTELVSRIYENAVAMVRGNRVPFEGSKTAVISVGGSCNNLFVQTLQSVGASFLTVDTKQATCDSLIKQLEPYTTVVVYLVTDRNVRGLPNEVVAGAHTMQSPEAACSSFAAARSSSVWGVDNVVSQMLEKISQEKRLVVVIFGSPHSARAVPCNQNTTVIWACEDVLDAQRVAAEVVCGIRQPQGLLPVELDDRFSSVAMPVRM